MQRVVKPITVVEVLKNNNKRKTNLHKREAYKEPSNAYHTAKNIYLKGAAKKAQVSGKANFSLYLLNLMTHILFLK